MATTNLESRSLGNILVQVGNGNPDHTADKGSLYTNKDTSTLYTNLDGTNTWLPYNKIGYIQMHLTDNTTEIAPGSLNQWNSTSSLAWTLGENQGFTFNAGKVSPNIGKDGKYMVIVAGCIRLDPTFTATYGFEIGVSKNGDNPVAGMFNGSRVGASVDTSSIGVIGYIDLVTSDEVEICIRSVSSTTPNQLLNQGSLILIRVGDTI